MTTKQFLKKNEKILNFTSMDAYCGFPAGTFSAVMRGKIKFSADRVQIIRSLLNRLADHCHDVLGTISPSKAIPTGKKGKRK